MNEFGMSAHRATTASDLRARIEETFTPSSPVARRDLFAGRAGALQQLLDLVQQPGRHVVLFGEPRTGKTSLATIVPEFAADPVSLVLVTAEAGDTFDTLWRKAADAVRTTLRRAERGLAASAFPSDTPTTLAKDAEASATDVVALLARLSAAAPAWVVFDAFDRAADPDTRLRMREVAESAGASAPRATLVFAGTATSGDRLMEPSSSLVPVQVPRFTADESVEAVLRALRVLGLTADDTVVERIATLANGLPHVTQGLARAAARAVATEGGGPIGNAQLDAAVRALLAEASEPLRAAYEQATVRASRGIYPEILLACALSPRDAYGTFSVADVCATVTRIVRR